MIDLLRLMPPEEKNMQKFLHTAPGGENTVVEQHINAVVRGGENQPVGLHRPDGVQRLADGLLGQTQVQDDLLIPGRVQGVEGKGGPVVTVRVQPQALDRKSVV